MFFQKSGLTDLSSVSLVSFVSQRITGKIQSWKQLSFWSYVRLLNLLDWLHNQMNWILPNCNQNTSLQHAWEFRYFFNNFLPLWTTAVLEKLTISVQVSFQKVLMIMIVFSNSKRRIQNFTEFREMVRKFEKPKRFFMSKSPDQTKSLAYAALCWYTRLYIQATSPACTKVYVCNCAHNSLQVVVKLSQIIPIHTLPHFFRKYFKIIPAFMPTFYASLPSLIHVAPVIFHLVT